MVALACFLPIAILSPLVAGTVRVVGISRGVPNGLSSRAAQNGTLNVSVAPEKKWVFDPPNLSASVGQQISFQFPSDPPLSVTQSTPDAPCTYLALGNGTVGFDTQLQTSIVFTIEVLDDQPVYFHCKHPGHCGMGMVGTINAPISGPGSYESFQAAALGLGQSAPNDSSDGRPTNGNTGSANPLNLPSGATSPMQLSHRGWFVSVAVLALTAISIVIS